MLAFVLFSVRSIRTKTRQGWELLLAHAPLHSFTSASISPGPTSRPRGGIARSLRGSSVFTVPRVRGSPRSTIGRVRTYASALASTSRQLTSSDSYTFIGARVPSPPPATPCHASRPLINFITRPNPRGQRSFDAGDTRDARGYSLHTGTPAKLAFHSVYTRCLRLAT